MNRDGLVSVMSRQVPLAVLNTDQVFVVTESMVHEKVEWRSRISLLCSVEVMRVGSSVSHIILS
jgi:hypothetical protein